MSNPSLSSENAAHDEPLNCSSLSSAAAGGAVNDHADRAEQPEPSNDSADGAAAEEGGANGPAIEGAAFMGLQRTPVLADNVQAQSQGLPTVDIDTPPASASAFAAATASTSPTLSDDTAPASISASPTAAAPVPSVSVSSGPDTQNLSTQDKRNRGLPQQSGPSLLSQALASARGIAQTTNKSSARPPTAPSSKPVTGTSAHSNIPSRRETPSTSVPTQYGAQDGLNKAQEADPTSRYNQQASQSSMATATATLSPASATATQTTTLPTLTGRNIASVPSTFEHSALEKAKDMLVERRDFLDLSRGRTSTSLDIDRRTLSTNTIRPLPHSTSPEDVSTPTNTTYLGTTKQLASTPPTIDDLTDARTQQRPKGLQQRATIGPEKTEKMWSIGAGEGSEEDGQVEKSVAEAMAGVEPNARSRKASYSLRFFKEGLPPEDKTRRKDTKSAPKDRLSPTIEERSVGSLGSVDKDPALTPPAPAGQSTPRSAGDKTSATTPGKSDTDYFTFEKSETTTDEDASSKLQPKQRADDHAEPSADTLKAVGPVPATDSDHKEGHHRKQPDSSDLGEHHDVARSDEENAELSAEIDVDAEDSGEEKISSAVFLPHQELTDSDVIETLTRESDWSGPRQRSLSQSKTRPWLVKADEPEPEPQEEVTEDHESAFDAHDGIKTGRTEHSPQYGVDSLVKVDERDPAHVSPRKQPSQVSQKQIDDHAHDHYHDAEEQLEAIELKPYKHQVGGHTTLWRFSRRAVCKQLNNRENEFYEIIERYHRDLLAFLPR